MIETTDYCGLFDVASTMPKVTFIESVLLDSKGAGFRVEYGVVLFTLVHTVSARHLNSEVLIELS